MMKDKKDKGFTLIELLAVIVILAIIALIAVPIVLNIINDAKESSNKRSIDLYAKAIENAIAREELNGNGIDPGDLDEEFLKTVEYNGSKVSCKTNKLYKDGTVYLADCKVNNLEVEYTYGEEIEEEYRQVYIPQYYGSNICDDIGKKLTTNNTTPDYESYGYVIGLDSDDGINISAAYTCFKRNGNEYCLKGADATAYQTNVNILNQAFKDLKNACTFETDKNSYKCNNDSLEISVNSDGSVSLNSYCYIKANGEFSSSSSLEPCLRTPTTPGILSDSN